MMVAQLVGHIELTTNLAKSGDLQFSCVAANKIGEHQNAEPLNLNGAVHNYAA